MMSENQGEERGVMKKMRKQKRWVGVGGLDSERERGGEDGGSEQRRREGGKTSASLQPSNMHVSAK